MRSRRLFTVSNVRGIRWGSEWGPLDWFAVTAGDGHGDTARWRVDDEVCGAGAPRSEQTVSSRAMQERPQVMEQGEASTHPA